MTGGRYLPAKHGAGALHRPRPSRRPAPPHLPRSPADHRDMPERTHSLRGRPSCLPTATAASSDAEDGYPPDLTRGALAPSSSTDSSTRSARGYAAFPRAPLIG